MLFGYTSLTSILGLKIVSPPNTLIYVRPLIGVGVKPNVLLYWTNIIMLQWFVWVEPFFCFQILLNAHI